MVFESMRLNGNLAKTLALPIPIPSTGPLNYDLCGSCDMPCRKACSQQASAVKVFSKTVFNQKELPARGGDYDRRICNLEMNINHQQADFLPTEEKERRMQVMAACRECEFVLSKFSARFGKRDLFY